MTDWVVLLRGINVGGHGKLPMARLRELALQVGLAEPRTYIQSGNLLVRSELDEAGVLAALAPVLAAELGRPVPVVARSADDWDALRTRTPWPDVEVPKSVHVWFFGAPITDDVMAAVGELVGGHGTGEQIELSGRELFLHTPGGFGVSKVVERLPRTLGKADPGTARNWATVTTLAGMLGR